MKNSLLMDTFRKIDFLKIEILEKKKLIDELENRIKLFELTGKEDISIFTMPPKMLEQDLNRVVKNNQRN